MSSRRPDPSAWLRTALVTGANRGIGLAVVRGLLARGLRVVGTARRLHDARALVSDSPGAPLIAHELDLAREESVDACARALAEDGIAVDVLVNNGAVLFEGDVLTTSSDEFRAAIDVNRNCPGNRICFRAGTSRRFPVWQVVKVEEQRSSVGCGCVKSAG